MPPTRRTRKSPRVATNVVLHDNDVLNGRGVAVAQRIGNQRFRYEVSLMKDTSYCELLSSTEKRALACEVVKKIKELKPPGRFLKRDSDGSYTELTESEALKKTRQALRDCNRPDREGYASQVEIPQDDTGRAGLTVQEIAQRRMDEEKSKRSRSRSRASRRNQQSPTASSTASRSSRRTTKEEPVISDFASTAETVSSNSTRTTRNTAPMEPAPVCLPMEPAPAITSTTNSWQLPSTVNATPAVRPPIGPAPVTQTPNASHYSFLQNYRQGIHPAMNHPGSNQIINANHVSSFNNQFTPRNTYNVHHPDVSRSIEPSPMVRSSNVRNNNIIFEEQPDLLEGWNRANLFPHEDALDSMAAKVDHAPPPAVDKFDRMAANVDFNFNDGAVHRNNRDLGI